ncbi:PREDICTED: eukaryotic translation initiation factor 3 subunit K isoform X3 [Colobus angolensis palliatus]|nr:PREDICTED: eukaryotic translation initiation factor 3 subunit K isoform X3 [Colobus angolensis palliatus]
MIDQAHQEERPIRQILYLGDLLETCHFQAFWQALDENMDLLEGITGFEDSVRKFICHVVGITYQHIDRWLLAEMLGDLSGNAFWVLVHIWEVGGGQGSGPQSAPPTGLCRSHQVSMEGPTQGGNKDLV